ADLLLVSGESIVRNLQEGLRSAGELGRAARVAYVADPFGHPAQLPQILRAFGYDTYVFARGMGDEGESVGSEFWWEAPSGDRVRPIPPDPPRRQLDACVDQTGERRLRAAPPRAVRAARRAHRWDRSRRAPRSLANAPAKPPARLDLRLLDRCGPRRRYGATLRIRARARHGARDPAARTARRAGDRGDALG